MTYTYAVLEVSPEAYAEVRALLAAAGYQHAFNDDSDGPCIDMHGIALRAKPGADMPAAERRLTELMDRAFANANHPLMLDWVAVMFELRRLRREAAEHEELRLRLSATVACSSPDGSAEAAQVEQAYAERVRLPPALTVLFYVLMRDADLTSQQVSEALVHVKAAVGVEPRFSNAQRQALAEELSEAFVRALARMD